jgi:hypothetical protein
MLGEFLHKLQTSDESSGYHSYDYDQICRRVVC